VHATTFETANLEAIDVSYNTMTRPFVEVKDPAHGWQTYMTGQVVIDGPGAVVNKNITEALSVKNGSTVSGNVLMGFPDTMAKYQAVLKGTKFLPASKAEAVADAMTVNAFLDAGAHKYWDFANSRKK
jgi:hypothetical protein